MSFLGGAEGDADLSLGVDPCWIGVTGSLGRRAGAAGTPTSRYQQPVCSLPT